MLITFQQNIVESYATPHFALSEGYILKYFRQTLLESEILVEPFSVKLA